MYNAPSPRSKRPGQCPKCDELNPLTASTCARCHSPLSKSHATSPARAQALKIVGGVMAVLLLARQQSQTRQAARTEPQNTMVAQAPSASVTATTRVVAPAQMPPPQVAQPQARQRYYPDPRETGNARVPRRRRRQVTRDRAPDASQRPSASMGTTTTPQQLVAQLSEEVRSATSGDELNATQMKAANLQSWFASKAQDAANTGRMTEYGAIHYLEGAMSHIVAAADQKSRAMNSPGLAESYMASVDLHLNLAQQAANPVEGTITIPS